MPAADRGCRPSGGSRFTLRRRLGGHEPLVGIDDIASFPVPYDWLPGRAETFYGDRFQVWSDLAEETIESLVNRPKGGIGTLRASSSIQTMNRRA